MDWQDAQESLEAIRRLVDEREWSEALALAEEAAVRFPDDALVHKTLAGRRYAVADVQGALVAAERALELTEDRPRMLLMLAAICYAAKAFDQAREYLAEARASGYRPKQSRRLSVLLFFADHMPAVQVAGAALGLVGFFLGLYAHAAGQVLLIAAPAAYLVYISVIRHRLGLGFSLLPFFVFAAYVAFVEVLWAVWPHLPG